MFSPFFLLYNTTLVRGLQPYFIAFHQIQDKR